MNPFTVSLTHDEALTIINLMQVGAKSIGGDNFDAAAGAYLNIKRKLAEASQATPKVEAVEEAA